MSADDIIFLDNGLLKGQVPALNDYLHIPN